MKISTKVHANCSEWDDEVESDYYIDDTYETFLAEQKKKAQEEIKLKGWDK